MLAERGAVPRRTFTEQARRAQIITAAIATIAEAGYRGASYAQIARRAGLSSTGLISYHFAGRDELMSEVAARVAGEISAFMHDRLAGIASPAAALRAYIEATIEFIGAHRAGMKALLEIYLNGGFRYDAAADQAVTPPIAGILRAGQQAGEFRDFDPAVMATVIQRAVDGLPFLLSADPDLDLPAYAAELVTTFDLATRARP